MANDLYMSIENHNRTKTEVKIYEAIANSSKYLLMMLENHLL